MRRRRARHPCLDPADKILDRLGATLGKVELDPRVAHGVVVPDPVEQDGQSSGQVNLGHARHGTPGTCR
jgi:hypothetical protein